MDDIKTIFITVIVILIIVILYYIYHINDIRLQILSGFWLLDTDFAEESGLTSFVLYIGNSCGINKYHGYILATNEDGIIINNQVEFHITNTISMLGIYDSKLKLTIDWLDMKPENESFSTSSYILFSPANNFMVIEDDDKILTKLWKNNQMSLK